jgi:hypothetical protein
MSTRAETTVPARTSAHDRAAPAGERPVGGARFDGMMSALGAWVIGGATLDAWAHGHLHELDRFFTPWHAVLYAGFGAIAAFLVINLLRYHAQGYAWARALPAGYGLSLVGLLITIVGGPGDLIWHELFGLELGVEGALSPTHLTLTVATGLMLTGPVRAAWGRGRANTSAWRDGLPLVLALALLLTLSALVTEYAQPLAQPWATTRAAGEAGQDLGVASVLVATVLLMGVTLFAVRHWRLPLGALTLMFTLSAAVMSILHDQYALVPGAALAGVAADALLWRLRPGPRRLPQFRVFAVTVPLVYYLLYFLSLALTAGIVWRIHLWLGATVIAMISSGLLSYLVAPPPSPAEDAGSLS